MEPRARCAGFSVAEIGNRKERLRDYASFPGFLPLNPLRTPSPPLKRAGTPCTRERGLRPGLTALRGASGGWVTGLAALSSLPGIRNASLPDSCFVALRAWRKRGYGVTGLPWAAAQTRLGTSPQTPSPLRGGLKPQNKKDPPQLSRSDSVVKGAGNSVPCRGLGQRPNRPLSPHLPR